MTIELPTIQLVLRPDIIDLGWGHPDPKLLPVAEMRQATAAALDRYGPDALAYGAAAGAGPLISWLRERIAAREGQAPDPEAIMITGGVSQALDQICTLWTEPGDVVLVESPTYHLAVRILREHPLTLVPVPCDTDGMQVEAAAAILARLRQEGRSARLLYTIPTYHNPTGACLSLERRKALVELAVAEHLLIIEDDVYRELAYDQPPPPSLWSMAPAGTVMRLGSFAKSLAPGLRLGWLTAAAHQVGRMADGGLLDSGGGVNHFTSLMVAAFCEAGHFDPQVARLCTAYRERRDTLARSLEEHLPPGCSFSMPGGGFFMWVRLPEGMDAAALLPKAEAAGVAYIPGARFHLDGRGANTLRLAYSMYPPSELAEAARRLGEALSSITSDE